MFVAFSGAAWDDAAFCGTFVRLSYPPRPFNPSSLGACLAVTGDKGTVNLQITNKVTCALPIVFDTRSY